MITSVISDFLPHI